jgi:hypothetical protein
MNPFFIHCAEARQVLVDENADIACWQSRRLSSRSAVFFVFRFSPLAKNVDELLESPLLLSPSFALSLRVHLLPGASGDIVLSIGGEILSARTGKGSDGSNAWENPSF